MELWELTVGELQHAYRSKACSPREVVDALLQRIESLDGGLGAFREVLADPARSEAEVQTAMLAGGEMRGPLHGIPVGVKELFDVAGALSCYGSRVFAGRVASTDAEVVKRLRSAGAIVIGITRSHEFGWGITTQHEQLGCTRNPWKRDRVPGGSSGGSAAALAAGMVPLALGTDTGGSVRIPAAFCGVAGLKPTFGMISRRGLVPLAPSLDHVGPMARSVRDLAIALPLMAGRDSADPATLRGSSPEPPALDGTLAGLRVATVPGLHLVPPANDHEQIFSRAVSTIAAAGAMVVQADLAEPERIRPAFAALQMAEAYHVHTTALRTYPSRAADYGADVRRRLELASATGIGDYLSAQQEARRIRSRFEDLLEGVDVIVTPVTAGPPSLISDPDMASLGGKPIPFRDLVMDYTVPQDITGLPACVVPAGFDAEGLPVGVQMTGPPRREDLVLRVAAALEDRLDFSPNRPDLG